MNWSVGTHIFFRYTLFYYFFVYILFIYIYFFVVVFNTHTLFTCHDTRLTTNKTICLWTWMYFVVQGNGALCLHGFCHGRRYWKRVCVQRERQRDRNRRRKKGTQISFLWCFVCVFACGQMWWDDNDDVSLMLYKHLILLYMIRNVSRKERHNIFNIFFTCG